MSTTTETEFLGEEIPIDAEALASGEKREQEMPSEGVVLTTECLNGGCIDKKPSS
ncbi:hypothetical protein [Saccharothrix xinjiangensis]|uniref:FxLD family lantipeptide n=1 Tax=Saccharothrix xinjiangensis TaxID=204798 RepID=A0ABV9YF06_9PSEU